MRWSELLDSAHQQDPESAELLTRPNLPPYFPLCDGPVAVSAHELTLLEAGMIEEGKRIGEVDRAQPALE